MPAAEERPKQHQAIRDNREFPVFGSRHSLVDVPTTATNLSVPIQYCRFPEFCKIPWESHRSRPPPPA